MEDTWKIDDTCKGRDYQTPFNKASEVLEKCVKSAGVLHAATTEARVAGGTRAFKKLNLNDPVHRNLALNARNAFGVSHENGVFQKPTDMTRIRNVEELLKQILEHWRGNGHLDSDESLRKDYLACDPGAYHKVVSASEIEPGTPAIVTPKQRWRTSVQPARTLPESI